MHTIAAAARSSPRAGKPVAEQRIQLQGHSSALAHYLGFAEAYMCNLSQEHSASRTHRRLLTSQLLIVITQTIRSWLSSIAPTQCTCSLQRARLGYDQPSTLDSITAVKNRVSCLPDSACSF